MEYAKNSQTIAKPLPNSGPILGGDPLMSMGSAGNKPVDA
jgi:hypothetical protein